MALVRWNPARDLFRDDMARIMDEFLGRRFDVESSTIWQPAVDIEENAEGYLVRAELPGMKLEDIKITLSEGQLVVRGEKRREEEKSGATYHRVERVYGTFERAFTLGHAVRTDAIEATYRDGVLEVRVPKAEEARTREIPIKVAK